MFKALKNPFIIITLIFIFFTTRLALTESQPSIKELTIPYSDDIAYFVNTIDKRSGQRQYGYTVGYEGVYFSSLSTRFSNTYQEIDMADYSKQGDYVKNLNILYEASSCHYIDTKIRCSKIYELSGEYYSQSFRQSFNFNRHGLAWWKFIVLYGYYFWASLLYLLSLYIMFIWKRRHLVNWAKLQPKKINRQQP